MRRPCDGWDMIVLCPRHSQTLPFYPLQRLQEMLHAGNAAVFPGLEEALQASLEDAGQRSKQRPAAAKDEVGATLLSRRWGCGGRASVCFW